MKKIILVSLIALASSCVTVKTEFENYETNKKVVELEYPNYHLTTFRQFNYIFQVSNPKHVIEVTLKKHQIIKRDTLTIFSSIVKN